MGRSVFVATPTLTRWALFVLAVAAMGKFARADLPVAVVAALLTVGVLVGVAHQLRQPWLVLAVAGVAALLLATPPSPGARVAFALLAALLAGTAAQLGRRGRSDRVVWSDGLYGVGLLILLSIVVTAMVPVPSGPLTTAHLSTLLVLYLLTPPLEALAVLLVLWQGRKLLRFLQLNYAWRPTSAREVGQGFAVGVAIILATSLLIQIESVWWKVPVAPNNPFVYDPRAAGAPALGIAALVLAVVVLAPLAEEALFRGLLFGGLLSRWGLWPAALVSAAIFGAAHLNLSLWLPLSTAGLLLALLYAKTRSLWSSTVAHATLNGVSVLLALLVR